MDTIQEILRLFLEKDLLERLLALLTLTPIAAFMLWLGTVFGLRHNKHITTFLKSDLALEKKRSKSIEADLQKERSLTDDWLPSRWLKAARQETKQDNFEQSIHIIEQGFLRSHKDYAAVTNLLAKHYAGLTTETPLALKESIKYARISVLLEPKNKEYSLLLEQLLLENEPIKEISNQTLVDFDHIPLDYETAILTASEILKRSHNLKIKGRYNLSLALLQRPINILKRNKLYNGNVALNIRHLRAELLSLCGSYTLSRDEYEALYDIQKSDEMFDPEHPETLKIRTGLAKQFSRLGEAQRARDEFQAIYDIQKRDDIHGPEHPITLSSQFNLATEHGHIGEYEKARDGLQAVYDIRRRKFGPEDQNTLTTRANLAHFLGNLGEHQRAKDEYQAIYDIEKRDDILGPEHPHTLTARENIAQQLGNLGEYKRARDEYQAVYDIQKRDDIHGPEHPKTINTLANLARYIGKSGEYVEAVKILDDICLKHHTTGNNQYAIYKAKFYRAEIWVAQNNSEKAKKEINELLKIITPIYSINHWLVRESNKLNEALLDFPEI